MRSRFLLFAIAAACAFAVGPARAQVTKVGSRQALAGNVAIDWHKFGPDGSFVSTPKSRHFGNLKVTLASSSGGLLLRREGTTWHGDFLPGQFLLSQPYQSDNFLVSFSPPVSAVGTQIDPGDQQNGQPPYTGMFVARLCLYGPSGNFLGMVQTTSTANANEDGSARFIGARSAGERIGTVSLLVSGVTPGFTVEGDLAANEMDVVLPASAPFAHQTATTYPTTAPASCR